MTADDLSAAFAQLPAAWRQVLPGWSEADEQRICQAVKAVSGDREIAPARPFRALELVAPADVRVLLAGQDPYPSRGHADGLAFSAARGRPPSLRRIFEVLAADRPGFVRTEPWVLDGWAQQGVLLLNTALTVEVGRSGSHLDCGWRALTSRIVHALSSNDPAPVAMLWGGRAREFFLQSVVDAHRWRVLATRHPSYDFKREFMGDGSHFAATAGLVDWWAHDS